MSEAPLQRLHPLTPLLNGIHMLAICIGAFSWEGYEKFGPLRCLLAIVGILVVAFLGSLGVWAATGFHVTDQELLIKEGLLVRRSRIILLERVQSIDLVRPFLARPFGLAELHLEVMGGQKTEGKLAFLTVSQAARLRLRLLALAAAGPQRTPAPSSSSSSSSIVLGTEAGTPQVPGSSPGSGPSSTVVANRDVLVSQLLTLPSLMVPLTMAICAIPLVMNLELSLVGIASAITAILAPAQFPTRQILSNWNFRIVEDGTSLRVHHGLLETRSATVPSARIQAVCVVEPLLWRKKGWWQARVDVAGYQLTTRDQSMGLLLPVGGPAAVKAIIELTLAQALGRETGGPEIIADLRLTPPPARARWLAPLAAKYLGFALTDEIITTRYGRFNHHQVFAPLARVQSVRVVQGPLERMLDLASVHVDTAGIRLTVAARYLDSRDAYRLAEELSIKAHQTTGNPLGNPSGEDTMESKSL